MAVSKAKNEQKKNELKQALNKRYKTLVKNHLKILQESLVEKDINLIELKKLLTSAQKVLDKAARKKIIHKNKAARHKSHFSKKINDLEKQLTIS